MARKSRSLQESVAQIPKTPWKAALYIRLSREDGDKEESDSIQNQREVLRKFADDDESLTVYGEFVDDGYSGTGFDRPGFQSMMEKLKQKDINCVLVKDLSRFGRNYIEVGKYLEQIFPFLNVRFISVGDQLDSYKNPQMMNTLIIPFKNIINDEYCRDISLKVRATLDRKRKDGKFIGAFACYGYQKDPSDKNRLVADEEAAQVVRQIYRWYVEGTSVLGITRRLNDAGIPNPAAYKQSQGLDYRPPGGKASAVLWNDRTVRRILHNQMYTGNLVQGVHRARSYKLPKSIPVPPEDWIVVENTHEPIVPQALFQQVQELLRRDTRTAPGTAQLSLFSGFLRCAGCGKAMIKKTNRRPYGDYVYYHCSTYCKVSKDACTKHTIREEDLYQAVLLSIQKQVEVAVSIDELLRRIQASPEAKRESLTLKRGIAEKEARLDKLRTFHRSLYEDWKNGDITREEYQDMKSGYTRHIAALQGELEQDYARREAEKNMIPHQDALLQGLLKFRNIQSLARDLLTELVDEILVHEDRTITIRFRFEDVFQLAADWMESNRTA